jgi:hypothetical protein
MAEKAPVNPAPPARAQRVSLDTRLRPASLALTWLDGMGGCLSGYGTGLSDWYQCPRGG